MNIQKMSQRAGIALLSLLGLAMVFSAYGINTIRFGGEAPHTANTSIIT